MSPELDIRHHRQLRKRRPISRLT